MDAWRFSDTADAERPSLTNRLTSGKIIDNVDEFLKFQYSSPFFFGTDNLKRSGVYQIHGWAYDFKPFLKKYVYKQYDLWEEIYAPNKTAIRKVVTGRIDQIQEIIRR